jgi:uncharacterized membrane protein YphA (DoxX/SURF4 family)
MDFAGFLFIVGRLLYGGYFLWNGINHFWHYEALKQYAASKKIPYSGIAVVVTGFLLLVGGLGVILGIYPVLSILALVLFLVPVTFLMHNFWSVTDEQMKMMEIINFSKNLALLGAALMFSILGSFWPLPVFTPPMF